MNMYAKRAGDEKEERPDNLQIKIGLDNRLNPWPITIALCFEIKYTVMRAPLVHSRIH